MHKAPQPHPEELAAENQLLRQQLQSLTNEATHNESILKRFHERELTLLAAEGLPHLLGCLVDGMSASFELPSVSLVLLDPEHEIRHLLIHSGLEPDSFPNISFLDRPGDCPSPLERLQAPWLGPFLGAEHIKLFPTGRALQSIAILPMLRRSEVVGYLCLGSRNLSRFTRHHASDFLHRLATIAALCLENAVNREHLVVSGLTDALTGLHNRRYLERRLEEEVTRALRYQHPLSCIFIDADHFKRINDNYGHNAGDAVLRELSLRVKECLRASDVATRFGGEEFALLLPQTEAREAFNLAERIRQKIEREPFTIHGGKQIPVAISQGVCALNILPSTASDDLGEQLLNKADEALYTAKQQGRNQVVLYRP